MEQNKKPLTNCMPAAQCEPGRRKNDSFFGHGVKQGLSLYPNPARPWSGPTKFLGTRLGLRKRPAGRARMSEAAGRACSGEQT